MSVFHVYTCSHTHKSTHIHIYTPRVRGCCFPWGYRCSHLAHQFPPWQHQECSSYNLQSLRPYAALLIKPSSAMRMHRIRQTARSISSSFAFAFARSLLLPWLRLNGQTQPIPYLSISSTTLRWNPTAALWLPHVNPLEQQRLDSCCWCPCQALDYFTWYFFKLSPTPS